MFRRETFTPLLCILSILMSVLTACSQTTTLSSSSETSPSYIAADSNHLAVLRWQQGDGTSVHGTWVSHTMPELDHVLLLPSSPVTTPWSGQMHGDTTLSLTAAGALLHGTLNGAHLTLSGSTPSGTVTGMIWTRVTSEHASRFEAAFDAFAQARLTTAQLKRSIGTPPPDSNSRTYAAQVGNAEETVATLEQKRKTLRGMQRICGTPPLALFWLASPPLASEFTLSSWEQTGKSAQENADLIVQHSTLATQLTDAEHARADVSRKSIPQGTGVPLTWSILSETGTAQDVLMQGKAKRTQFLQALTTDLTTMTQMKKHADQINAEIEEKAREDGCPRHA